MTKIFKNICKRIKSLTFREDGVATVEFVMIFPAALLLMFMAGENVLMNVKKTKLDHALEVVIRDLRMGNISNPTLASLRTRLCAEMDNPDGCTTDITIEMTVRDPMVTNMSVPSLTATCVNRAANIDPVLSFDAGGANQLVLVRVCYVIDVMSPTSLNGFTVANVVGTEHSLVSTSAFVNEPN